MSLTSGPMLCLNSTEPSGSDQKTLLCSRESPSPCLFEDSSSSEIEIFPLLFPFLWAFVRSYEPASSVTPTPKMGASRQQCASHRRILISEQITDKPREVAKSIFKSDKCERYFKYIAQPKYFSRNFGFRKRGEIKNMTILMLLYNTDSK